jgi:uncharacterized membrane protein
MDPKDRPAAYSHDGQDGQTSRRRPYPRDTALDGLRTLAVLLMISSHTSRLILWDARRDWSRFVLLIEPLTASLFLILVGASLVHSWRSAEPLGRAAWYRKQSLRAAALWALSCLFYTLEDGFHWPDAVILSGILATIAYTILIGMLLVSRRHAAPILMALSAALAALHLYLDHIHAQWFMVNAGNSPLLPLCLFACLGALGALALESRNRWIRPALVTCALLALGVVLGRHAFADIFSKPLGRYETLRTMVSGTAEARVEKSIPYYNLRPILVPVIAAMVVLLYAALAALRPMWNRTARILFAPGRRSLDVYILHLSLLAILVVSGGLRPLKRNWQGDLTLAAVILICYFWAIGRDILRARKQTEKAAA